MPQKNVIVVSDLDGTLTDQSSSWQYVFEELGLWVNQAELNLKKFLAKEICYDQFIELDVSLLKGVPIKQYLKIIESINYRTGLIDLFEYLKTINSTNIIVSSGLMDLAERINKEIPFSQIYANKIYRNNQYLDGRYEKIVGWHGKEKIMSQIKNSNPNSFIIAFGDTSADLPLIRFSDLNFSCFSNSDELNSAAQYQITNLLDAAKIIQKTLGQ